MLNARKTLLKDIINLLKQDDYVAVKYILEDITDLAPASDLDLLVSPPLIDKIYSFCQAHLLVAKIKSERVFERTTLRIYLADGGFLKLDLLEDLIWKDLQYLPVEPLSKQRIQYGDVWSYHPLYLFEHVLLYYYLNESGVPAKYIRFFQQLQIGISSILLPYFNKKYGTHIFTLEELSEYKPKQRTIIRNHLQQQAENKGRKRISRFIRSAWAQVKRRIPRMGKIVTFTGVDGVGKTTLLNVLEDTLSQQHGTKVIRLRHRPGILPIISAWRYGKVGAEQRSVSSLPRQGNNKSTWQSYLRFAYYYMDYLLGQYWVKLRYCSLGYIVLYDRYYFDFIVDSKRSNISIDSLWAQQLYCCLLSPQLNFFFYADANTILSRKQELKREDIEALTKGYSQLFSSLKNKAVHAYHLIKNDNQQQSMKQVLQWYNHQIA